jgi:site-specific DNA-methyltransferase (adenine-specific)/modification methylase
MFEEVTIGECRLILGDCREILPTLPKVDLILTDPPYGIGLAGGFSGAGGFGSPIQRREYDGDWDNSAPDPDVIRAIICAGDTAILWGGNYFTDNLPVNGAWLVWDKQNTMPTFSDCELAWTNISRKNVKRIVHMQNGCMTKEKERFHPTQKPVRVMEWCIEQCKITRTILDPFMGSGTTGVACANMGKHFTGIERERKYFDIACRRIEQAYAQPRLFEDAKVGAGETAVQGDLLTAN